MPGLATSEAIPAVLARVARLVPASASAPPALTAALVPLLVATALGHGHEWLPHCLRQALVPHPPLAPGVAPPPPPPATHPLADATVHPRRLVVAQIKEALLKSAILVGVPRIISVLLHLPTALDDSRDMATAAVRTGLFSDSVADRERAGRMGLDSVYRGELAGIWQLMHQKGMDDLRYLSETSTYGTFLTPHPPMPHSPDPLAHDPRLLSIVTLSNLVPQRTAREIEWHLRGALRRGWTRPEVEQLHTAIETVCTACGVNNISEGMPRVADIPLQPEEGEPETRQGDSIA